MAGKMFGEINKNHFHEIKFGNSRVALYIKTPMNLQLAKYIWQSTQTIVNCQI